MFDILVEARDCGREITLHFGGFATEKEAEDYAGQRFGGWREPDSAIIRGWLVVPADPI